MTDHLIRNRLKDAVKRPDVVNDSFKIITEAVQAQFDQPVAVGFVVALRDGDVYDTLAAGNMPPMLMEVCVNTINHSTIEEEVLKARAAEEQETTPATDTDEGRPPNVPADAWEAMPPHMKALVRQGAEVVVLDEDEFDELIEHQGSLGGFDEDY